jgi:acetoin utilization deacetylase AcuC-like enzyme
MIPVFFSDKMVANAESFSPSAGKPALAVKAWQDEGLPVEILDPVPCTQAELCRAHDKQYVTDVLMGIARNGFGNTKEEVAKSLPFTSGAMLSAARKALETGVACAPVSGFHHAGFAYGGGFCTFNGLMVAACALLAEKPDMRILILDCDMHYGDGTDDIIDRSNGLAEQIDHHTFGEFFSYPEEGEAYIETLKDIAGEFHKYDLILYQAGADVHVNDPLGGVLTTEQMITRDRIVFEAASAMSVPVAWNLAGGYQDPVSNVVRLHINTMTECVRTYCENAAKKTA